jgi:dsDNA-specific endonuclease/ATPase MutS2
MSFKAGDRVALINEDLEGEVIAVSGGIIVVLDQDGFEREFSPDELVKKKDFLSHVDTVAPKSVDRPGKLKRSKSLSGDPDVIDLHFHEIYHTDRGLSNYDKLSYQLDFAMDKINQARKNKKRSIVFIHGKGTGVLKSELRSMIKKLENCYYEDADWRKYGQGATTVIIGYK